MSETPDYIDCPVCGEGYPAEYPGIKEEVERYEALVAQNDLLRDTAAALLNALEAIAPLAEALEEALPLYHGMET
jgi:hypothetical protein